MKNDELGTRMKEQYEDRTRYQLPRRTYTIIRLDGKAFHTFTKGCERPFDKRLMGVMDRTALSLCEAIQGVVLAYVQSDEISLVLTDFTNIKTNAWFDGNVQKMVSISASIAATSFNFFNDKLAMTPKSLAQFDSRVFTIPDRAEVLNYLIWRQQDATRNSIQMVAQALYSQKELHGKNVNDLRDMIMAKGVNWNTYTSGAKRGRAIVKETYTVPARTLDVFPSVQIPETTRRHWIVLDGEPGNLETPIFTADREFLLSRIPVIGENNE